MNDSSTIPENVYFVLPPCALLLDVAGPTEVLRHVQLLDSEAHIEVHYIAATPFSSTSIGLPLAPLEGFPRAIPAGSLVIVGGSTDKKKLNDPDWREGSLPSVVDETDVLIDWLRECIKGDHQLVTICLGALLAGKAGLLDGRVCTTHHSLLTELQRIAPTAKISDNRLFVEDGNIATSAGVTTGIDLMLHLVGKWYGSRAVHAIARELVVFTRRNGSDSQFSPWLEGRNHMDAANHRLQDAICLAPEEDWPAEKLASVAIFSTRQLYRVFKEKTGQTPTQYINAIRVALAEKILEHSSESVEVIVYKTGFSSAKHFRRVWSLYHRQTPLTWRRQRNTDV
jgi:transcriptional regulator GlxA family with amidase domain